MRVYHAISRMHLARRVNLSQQEWRDRSERVSRNQVRGRVWLRMFMQLPLQRKSLSKETERNSSVRVHSGSLGLPPPALFIVGPCIEPTLSKNLCLSAEIREPNFSYNFDPPRDRTQKRNRPKLLQFQWPIYNTPISWICSGRVSEGETQFPKYSNIQMFCIEAAATKSGLSR